MGTETKIEWCDATFNPWRGCTKVSDGCKNCYADTLSKRNPGTLGIWGPNGTRVVASEAMWREPVKWNMDAQVALEQQRVDDNKPAYQRPRVFCASLADVFEDWNGCPTFPDGSAVIQCRNCRKFVKSGSDDHGNCCGECGSGAVEMVSLDHVRARLFALIDATPNLDWLLLTKRPENIRKMWPIEPTGKMESPIPTLPPMPTYARKKRQNSWLGTTVENQEQAERRISELRKCRDLSPVLFLSCEPLLGPVDIGSSFDDPEKSQDAFCFIDWVIAGGESGPNARPMHPDWVRSLRDQCQAAEVPFLFKQWGELAPASQIEGGVDIESLRKSTAIDQSGRIYEKNEKLPKSVGVEILHRVGKSKSGRLLDGREWNEFPKVGGAA